MEYKNEKQELRTFKNKYLINENTCLLYDELPVTEGSEIGCQGFINSIPCIIFRKEASQATLDYLMAKHPMIKSYFEEVPEYAPTIIDCMVDYDRAFYFQIDSTGEMVAVLELPLWETAEDDFYELINLIHYTQDYEDNPDGVFMDDYGLC